MAPVFLRRDNHDHLAVFELWKLLDHAVFLQIALDPFKELDTQFLVRHLPTSEAKCHLRLVAGGEKPYQVSQFDLVVAFLGTRAKLDFLDVYLLLLAPSGLGLFALFEYELAVIHYTADRRIRVRRHFDEIQVLILRHFNRVVDRHDSNLTAIRSDQPDTIGGNFIIASNTLRLNDSLCSLLPLRILYRAMHCGRGSDQGHALPLAPGSPRPPDNAFPPSVKTGSGRPAIVSVAAGTTQDRGRQPPLPAIGRREWDRTTDPHHVKVVLYR